METLYLDLHWAVGYWQEESDAQPQSLQKEDNQPLRPVKEYVLGSIPPLILEAEMLIRMIHGAHVLIINITP